MTPLIKGLMWFIPSLVVLILISLKVFDEDKRVDLSGLENSLWVSRGGLFILFLVFLGVKTENTIKDFTALGGFKATDWFYHFEGVEHIVFLQTHLDNFIIIHISSIFYTLGLTFFVVFTPIFFLARHEKDNFMFFSRALLVNYFFILPGYFLLHVTVTSLYAPEVEPIMYSNDQYYAILYLINRLTNCFPSGHISISLTITLMALFKAKLKRFGVFGIIFTISTGFVIIYLGVHWLTDIAAGIVIGSFTYWAVKNGKVDFIFDPIIDFFERKTEHLRDRS
ncbi:MAG: phosphatase PAP2 family protein [Thermoplasmata archaeon]